MDLHDHVLALQPLDAEARLERAIEAWDASWPDLANLARRQGVQPPVFEDSDHWNCLLRSICHQQVSMASGRAIHGRAIEVGAESPRGLLELEEEHRLVIGLSGSKWRALRGSAERFLAGFNPTQIALAPMGDAVRAWSELPGVGPWTAKMILLFQDQRPDVFAHEDLGVRIAATRFLGLPEDDRVRWKQLRALEPRLGPHGSAATSVLWQALEG